MLTQLTRVQVLTQGGGGQSIISDTAGSDHTPAPAEEGSTAPSAPQLLRPGLLAGVEGSTSHYSDLGAGIGTCIVGKFHVILNKTTTVSSN